MMGGKSMLRNDKGASLVLVLVAMLFVGIIGGIVLTLTVGNAKSTKSTINDSESFYTSESAMDDFQMFIKKLATSAATQAYADTLEKVGSEEDYKLNFKKRFYESIQNSVKIHLGADNALETGFISNQISTGRSETVTIKIGSIEYGGYDPGLADEVVKENSNPIILKDVEVTVLDASGSMNKVTADVTVQANMPKVETVDTSEDFIYDIDHFVMIAGGSINPDNDYVSGDITGSIYAYKDLNIRTILNSDPTLSKSENIKADSVIVGGNINVDGVLNIAPIGDTSVSEVRVREEEDETRNVGVEIWSDGVKINGSKAQMTISKDSEDDSLTTEMYLRDSLELNGKYAQFKATCNRLYGFSGSGADVYYNGSANLLSSAIILNGLGAKLDLSGVGDLQLAGTAYTALPTVAGVDELYSYYNGETSEPTNLYYYTQGESITYRALQALYLIPGDFIKGIGHNPMKKSEYEALLQKNQDGTLKKDSLGNYIPNEDYLDMDKAEPYVGHKADATHDGNDYLLGGTVWKSHYVRYLNGDEYVYLFWNFSSTASAVTYFNRITGSKKKYEGLVGKQLDILENNNGHILLPDESNIKTKGNNIEYSSSTFTSKAGGSVSVSKYDDQYKCIKSELRDECDTLKKGKKLTDNMFGGTFGSAHLANKFFKGELSYGVLSPYKDANGNAITYAEHSSSDTKYYLITGPNVQLGNVGASHGDDWQKVESVSTDYTYIIITPGDVDIQLTSSFRGMIIAGGDIYYKDGLDMECLGMIERTPSNTGVKEVVSEFQALLGIRTGVKEEKPTEPLNANNRLEAIFNVFNNSGSSGGKSNEFVTVNIGEFARN